MGRGIFSVAFFVVFIIILIFNRFRIRITFFSFMNDLVFCYTHIDTICKTCVASSNRGDKGRTTSISL